MRKFLLSLLLLAGATTTAKLVFAGDWDDMPTGGRERFYRSAPASMNKYSSALSTQVGYGDSLYVGYSPGNRTAANPWSIRSSFTNAGTTNVHRPPKAGCMWNWDPEEAGNTYINGDSLMGWWPSRLQWRYNIDTGEPDYNLPALSIDYGNLTNYYPVHGRTFGVVGVWHRDQGGDPTGTGAALNGMASNGVTWRPLEGQYSAWCGLRQHKVSADGLNTRDATIPVDAQTGNGFDADAAMFNVHIRYSGGVAAPKYPGYVDQWDQMLYRDIDFGTALTGNLQLRFKYSTRMSTTADLLGWFDKDPLTTTSDGTVNCASTNADGIANYISNWDLAGAGPVDSFMVYVGQPTEGTFQRFNGTCSAPSGRTAIFDPLRRWFDEVVEANAPGRVLQLISAAGNDSNHVVNVTIPNGQLAPILSASSGKVRLVFRVKTNSQVSDVTNASYNSGGRGAAQIDSVAYFISGGGSAPSGWGTFESATSIDNTQSAQNAWRSTGKPPQIMTHHEKLGNPGVPYDDLCGSDPAAVGRVCSMNNGVIVFGLHDLGDAIGNPANYTSDHEVSNVIISPTLPLIGPYPNAIGINAASDVIATNDVMLDYEVFAKGTTADAPPVATGLLYRWLFVGYPQKTGGSSPNQKQWGNVIRSFANYQTDAICFRSLPGITGQEGTMKALGMFKYSTDVAVGGADYPDSMKVGWDCESLCWLTGVNACNPIGGVYIDNTSVVFIDGTALPLSGEIWNMYQTSFPWNEGVTPAFNAAFDTAAVLVKSGLDTGPPDGINSFDVPGDSIVAASSGAAPMRVDLVFRILPGPGNYRTVGNANSGLTPNPSSFPLTPAGRPATVPNVASTNFWNSFLANKGPFGSSIGHVGNVWNPNVWNSARCDTTEANLFPRAVGTPTAFSWQSTYHEEELGIGAGDAYTGTTVVRAGLGLRRHKCFLASNTAQLTDVDCEHDPDGIETPASGTTPGPYDLTWVLATGSGYGADLGTHPYGRQYTIEGTKIIPDGLLTPGSHVQYFWRKAEGGTTTMTGMMPDTNVVVPQLSYRDNDGRRFQAFGVLPDPWKEVGRTHPLGIVTGNPACMLVVNDQTTNGNSWHIWTGVSDTIGVTAQQKWGADIGWHAVGGGLDPNNAANNRDRAGRVGFPAENLGNQGSTWDAYQIIGAEDTAPAGSFGARYAISDASNTQINNKRQQGTPSLEQLKAFYKIIFWLTGNLNAFHTGPSGDRGSDDQQLIKDWLLSGNPASPNSLNRVFWAMGDGYVEGNEKEPDLTKQPDLDLNYLGVGLQNGGYRLESGNAATTITLNAKNDSLYHGVWGVRNTCTHSDDVLKVGLGAVAAQTSVWTEYQDPNTADAITYPAATYKKWDSTKPWAAITEGATIEDLVSSPRPHLGVVDSKGRHTYISQVLWFLSRNSSCQTANGQGLIPLDVPNISDGNMLVDFVSMRNNPVMVGMARIHFGLARDDRVQIKVFDVTGREVRVLADRAFKAGEHDVVWDGTDNTGRPVARGVYFTQVRYRESAFNDAKKVTLLR